MLAWKMAMKQKLVTEGPPGRVTSLHRRHQPTLYGLFIKGDNLS